MNYGLIGRKVHECRKHKDMSQAELAERVDRSVAYIGFIENGIRHPSLDTLFKISIVLDTSVDYLLTGYHKSDALQYSGELDMLIKDCTSYERYILCRMVAAMKSILRDKAHLFVSDKVL